MTIAKHYSVRSKMFPKSPKINQFQKSNKIGSTTYEKQFSDSTFSLKPSSSQSLELTEIHDLFKNTCQESNFSGRISIKHLKVILKALNLDHSVYDFNEITRQLDPNSEGFVFLSDLAEVIKMKRRDICSENDLRRAFRLMDESGKGFVTFEDLKKINEEIGENMSEEEIQEMIDEADVDSVGVVTEDSFVTYMLKVQEDSIKCNCG